MGRRLAMLLATGALALTAGPTLAHHSFAMFDRDNQVDLEGVVREFRFVNPHTFIYLVVKHDDGSTVTWTLEGQSPSPSRPRGLDQQNSQAWPMSSGCGLPRCAAAHQAAPGRRIRSASATGARSRCRTALSAFPNRPT